MGWLDQMMASVLPEIDADQGAAASPPSEAVATAAQSNPADVVSGVADGQLTLQQEGGFLNPEQVQTLAGQLGLPVDGLLGQAAEVPTDPQQTSGLVQQGIAFLRDRFRG
jgi:hypothetical protein